MAAQPIPEDDYKLDDDELHLSPSNSRLLSSLVGSPSSETHSSKPRISNWRGSIEKISKLVKKEEYLTLYGKNWNKGWGKLYIVLHGPFLVAYEDDAKISPKGVVVLEGCSVESCPTAKYGKAFCFEISHPESKLMLGVYHADSEEKREAWINAIREAIQWLFLTPDVMKSYEELEAQLLKMRKDLQALIDGQDEMEKEMVELQREIEDRNTYHSIAKLIIADKEHTVQEQDEEIRRLRAQLPEIRQAPVMRNLFGGPSKNAILAGELQEKIQLMEMNKRKTAKEVRELADKTNRKTVERELLRREVLRLRKRAGEHIPTPVTHE
eukprot:TRINITY_DN31985_c0_g1_i1.p1 TRINITY_DN31985_c0_g1~~TRINITY_DN31985_c0_g1_i1.p1  ORF type:complete len:325 (+),score=84.72 TRINITY_DN31985_c0_g1_i1:55-1029(+)